MWFLNRYYQNQRNKGFLLMDLLIGLAVGSILFTSICSLFKYCINSSKIAEEKEDLTLNGRYAIEYMKNEIKSADEIILIDKIKGYDEKYSNNFGFVIKQKIEIKLLKPINKDKRFENRYIIYYINDCYLRRDSVTQKTERIPEAREFSGSNTIAEKIKSIDGSHIDFNDKRIIIMLKLCGRWNKSLEVGTEIYVRSPIINWGVIIA